MPLNDAVAPDTLPANDPDVVVTAPLAVGTGDAADDGFADGADEPEAVGIGEFRFVGELPGDGDVDGTGDVPAAGAPDATGPGSAGPTFVPPPHATSVAAAIATGATPRRKMKRVARANALPR